MRDGLLAFTALSSACNTVTHALTLNLLIVLNGIINLPFLEMSIIIYGGYQGENIYLASHKYGTWSDCTDVQAGLALYLWQRLITFVSSRIRVK